MISQDTIDQIFSRALVEEVIGDFVQLKKSGSAYKGLSPFANERTPSFVVSPAKQIWKDFSSGKGGNVVSFLMEHEHFTYLEALGYLARKYNIEFKEEKMRSAGEEQTANEKESLYIIQEYAQRFFREQLKESQEECNIGLSYLKERGFSEETIEKFQLGYATEDRKRFTERALKEGFQMEYLEKSGLSIIKSEEVFDRFRGRIIFPIHSFSGRVLGFGGRILRSNAHAAKYLNSPESNIYHKSQILYGIHQAKQAILKEGNCHLVEGYTDMISLYQAGVQNVVASSGTALTVDQICLIKRLTTNIVLLYDGDSAGIKAALRGIDLILEQEMNVRVLLFPDGEDPDSFARSHTSSDLIAFLKEESQDFIHFKTQLLLKKGKNDPIKHATLIRDVVESISKTSNLIRREVYIKETAKMLEISERVLFQELAQIDRKSLREEEKKFRQESIRAKIQINLESTDEIDPLEILEEELISLMLLHGEHPLPAVEGLSKERNIIQEVIEHFDADHMGFSNPFYQKIFREIQEGLAKNEYRTVNYFLELNDETLARFISSKLVEPDQLARFDKKGIHIIPREKKLTHYFQQALLRYKAHYISKLIEKRKDALKQANDADLSLKEICRLIDLKNKINKELGREV
ncbi:DNA primase [Bacteroidetes bacterium endosymbiont of Geopemphigus sp.]|uniref:DNA primase n=1 Tax=Bacteroidetes bacterium endosymbiont of Geopemphigus sp. TaxID=2047937 RepID=UPI000CD270A6|nr:DNA primase [Bacteroidetes bacterium endosymbiont of Geopemphigus sp.]